MHKYFIVIKILLLIFLVFVFNFFLDMVNAKDWMLFGVGMVGSILTVMVFVGVLLYKKKGKGVQDEKVTG